MPGALLVLPLLLPLAGAALGLVAGPGRAQRLLTVTTAGGMVAVAVALLAEVWRGGVLVLQVGNWPAPFGITLVADLLSAAMVLITAVIGLAGIVYSLSVIDEARRRGGYYPLLLVLLMGVSGAFVAGDLFNLYVWFEVLLIASFALLVLGNTAGQVRGAVPYVVLSLVSSATFLAGIGFVYALTGSLNLAAIAMGLASAPPATVTVVAGLFVVAFGIKAAVFPLFFWLPDSYPAAPVPVAAVFAGLLTKVGVYALIRVFTLLFTHDVALTHGFLLAVAAATMLTGVLGAVAQSDVRRILSFHIVSQVGYMVMGLALYTPLALAGAVFYTLHHILVKANLFLIGGLIQRAGGSFDLAGLGGLYRSRPGLALLFAIPAASLAGLPPMSGFWAKLLVIQAGLDTGAYVVVAVALLVGAFTLLSMTKIWLQAFWEPAPDPAPTATPAAAAMVAPAVALAALTVAIGLWATPLLTLAERAAAELMRPEVYVQAVLGGMAP
jgi:multicomponent Na+:H+ antiporter subunit D